jgi:hypothetical protein
VVHLAVPLRRNTIWVKAERGCLGKNRLDSFRGLNAANVPTYAIALPKPECEVSAFLLSLGFESMRALPSLLIAVCDRRDQVYRISSAHFLPTKLDILFDNSTDRSKRRQES